MYKPKHFRLHPSGVWPGIKKPKIPPYVFTDEIAIAVDVAFATQRPLLVSGPPGSGKSMLAPTLARIKRWRYLDRTFTSRTRLEDLTGELDQVRRLADAQAMAEGEKLPPRWSYLEPGILWWAFRPESALRRGLGQFEVDALGDDFQPARAPKGPLSGNAVLLLDEIDKAEPDIPNDLLEPLEERRFTVPQGPEIEAPAKLRYLVVITTNGERELPPAFLRRCISLDLKRPDPNRLANIARQHYPSGDQDLHLAMAERVDELSEQARRLDIRPPSTSEYLDAIEACAKLGVPADPDNTTWQQIVNATLIKEPLDDDEEDADEAW